MLLASETSIQLTNALEKLIDSGIQLGERVLGALIIFIIGKFLVNWLNRLFARILEKRKVDPSIQSFLKSMVNILLLIMLILAVIGKLGIELTGFAALLASAGVAIGMALSGNLQNFAGGLIILLFSLIKWGTLSKLLRCLGNSKRNTDFSYYSYHCRQQDDICT